MDTSSSRRIAGLAAVVVVTSVLGAGDQQDGFDKDAFRARKKWYVSFVEQLKGKGESTKTVGQDRWTAKWDIYREVTGTFVLEEVHSGANSRPRKSTLGSGETADGRFVSWDVLEGLSNVSWYVNDRVSHTSVTHGEANAPTYVSGSSNFAGAGIAQLGRDKELKCDLKEMVFDFDLSGLRNVRRDRVDGTKPLILTGEFHSETPATSMREDFSYPLLECGPDNVLPKLTESLRQQMLSRKLELVKDGLRFTVAEPVTVLPHFPSHPGNVPDSALKFDRRPTTGGLPLQLSVEVTLSPTPPTIASLLLEPIGYETWRPLCSVAEEVKGNDLAVAWRVVEEGGDPSRPPNVTRVAFALVGTSAEPGVCMNWPLRPRSPPGPDLKFAGGEAPRPGYEVRSEGQELILTGGAAGANRGTVTVDCFDSGATAMMVAEATLEDGRILRAKVVGSGRAQLMIPDFQPGVSWIARDWREKNAPGKKDDADDENDPEGDGQQGDGLTVWEEYRGFWSGGKWLGWCNPKKKDLLVFNGIGAAAYSGILLFESATGLVVHQSLAQGEIKADRVVNFNHATRPHLVDQHCIVVSEGGFESKDDAGKVVSTGSICRMAGNATFPGPPKNTWEVSLLPSMLAGTTPQWQFRNGESYQVASADRTIAHELGHGLGIRHHGDKDTGWQTWTFQWRGDRGDFVTFVDGRETTIQDEQELVVVNPADLFPGMQPGEGKSVWLGERNGQHSGDEACFMRYAIAGAYRSQLENAVLYYYRTGEIKGIRLCTSPAGTGVNMPTHAPQSRFGGCDSGRGDCKHKFVVSDRWEKRN